MKRLLLLTAAGLTVVALAGAVGLPDLAGAQDAAQTPDSITVSGLGTVDAVPNEAQMSFGAETRRPTAQAAVAANADAMRRIINALRQAGGRGYMRSYAPERLLRELRVDRIWEGTSEIQRVIVTRGLERRGVERMLH